MPTQAERREATRARLIAAALKHFAKDGYEATHTDAILRTAGVSRGALYHHFAGKQELFAAVFEHVSAAAIQRAVRKSRSGTSARTALVGGCLAWLREARRPEVAAILLDQGPQVLGWYRAREIENRHSARVMKQAVQAAADAGELRVASVDLAAAVLNAALAELALASRHANKTSDPAVIERTVRDLVHGFAGNAR